MAGSPSFFGINPAEVREGPKKGTADSRRRRGRGPRAARRRSTRRSARRRSSTPTAPGDMVTMANVNITPLSPTGHRRRRDDPAQRDLLTKLIDVYTGFMAADIAADRTARFKKAGVEKIGFAWAGSTEKGAKHYYRDSGADVPDRIRQHAERRQPHPLGVARFRRRLRPRSAARARQVGCPLARGLNRRSKFPPNTFSRTSTSAPSSSSTADCCS